MPNGLASIGNAAFCRCIGLTNVTIPESVTSIGNYAFEDCSSLTSIAIPSSVMSIGTEAFKGCENLKSIMISDNVMSIGECAFEGCRSLTDIYVNQLKNTLLDNAAVSSSCTIHWNPSLIKRKRIMKEKAPMTVEEIQNCTMGNARELAAFAQDHDICVAGHAVWDVYDLNDEEDNDSIAEIIGDILTCSKIKVVYDYIKQAVEGTVERNVRFVWEVNGFLVPFTESDLEQLKDAVLEALEGAIIK